MREFAVTLDADVDAGDRALRRRGRQPGLPARARLPGDETACSSRSPSSAARPTSTGSRARCRRPSVRACTHDDARRDVPAARPRATIFEKSQSGRRAFVAPALDVPRPLDELLPERLPPRRAGAAAGGRRAGDQPPLQPALEAQLRPRHRLLPARLVHDEAQPEAARAGRRAAGPRAAAPAAAPAPRPGRAAADVGAPARARRGRRPPARLAAAVSAGLARRAGRRAADARLPRGARRAADQGAHARHGARHQPGDGDDGAATRSSRSAPTTAAASTSRTCGPRQATTSPA